LAAVSTTVPATEPAIALSARDVVMRFGGVTALKGVDLDLPLGSWCGLVGPNGSGKSTLLNVLTGIYLPQEGAVQLAGRDVTRSSVRYRALEGVVRTFQHPQLARTLTVRENVEVGAALSRRLGLSRKQCDQAAEESLAAFGCMDYAGALPDEIPYGTRKIIELARALAARPVVLLLDEPAAGLSSEEREELVAALATFRAAEPSLSVCLVEHDVPFVSALCEQLVVLDAGASLCTGPSAEVLANPRVREAFLGLAPEVSAKLSPATLEVGPSALTVGEDP